MKINKDQAFFSRWQKLKFVLLRGSGHFSAYLINRLQWHYFPRFHYVSKFPIHVDIEISSLCNMRCPMCYTISEEFSSNVDKGFMDMRIFKKIIDECSMYGAYSIRISLRGEPFIHNDAIAMIRYAKKKGISEVSSLTNNLALTPALFKEAMEAGLDWLTISFDGLGQIYEGIRKPANFEESFQKIKEYKSIKIKARSRKPLIKVQTVWPAIKDCAKDYFDAFSPYVDHIAINPLIDYLHQDKDIIYIKKFVCPVLYQRLAIGSDGRVLLCSNDEFTSHPIGDANQESLYSIWHGSQLTEAREIHKQHKGIGSFQACKQCYLPRKTQSVNEHIGKNNIVIDKYINRPDNLESQ